MRATKQGILAVTVATGHPVAEHVYRRLPRRRYDLHPPGLIYLVTSLFLAIGALNSQNNLLFWAFGVAVAGLMVSGVVSGSALMHLRVEREPSLPSHVGDQITLRYRLSNSSRLWPLFGLRIEETQPGSPRNRPLICAAGGVAHVGPRQSVTGSVRALARVRGSHSLGTVQVSTTFPLGLVRKTLLFELPGHVIVRPAIAPLRNEVASRIVPAREDASVSRARVGQGGDFFGLREYVPGDPMRTIAWRPSARRDTLLVRQCTIAAPPRLWLRLAEPAPSVSESDFENTIALLASIINHTARRGATPGLLIDWADVHLPPVASQSSTSRMLDLLATLSREGERSMARNGAPADILIAYDSRSADPHAIDGSDPARWAATKVVTIVPPPSAKRRRMRKAST